MADEVARPGPLSHQGVDPDDHIPKVWKDNGKERWPMVANRDPVAFVRKAEFAGLLPKATRGG